MEVIIVGSQKPPKAQASKLTPAASVYRPPIPPLNPYHSVMYPHMAVPPGAMYMMPMAPFYPQHIYQVPMPTAIPLHQLSGQDYQATAQALKAAQERHQNQMIAYDLKHKIDKEQSIYEQLGTDLVWLKAEIGKKRINDPVLEGMQQQAAMLEKTRNDLKRAIAKLKQDYLTLVGK